jgi:type IV secretion/conjugal transfer VirB4 family ATPase
MFIRKEAREHVEGFPDLLDYSSLLEDGIAFLRSGTFLAAWEVAGPDNDPMPLSEQYYLASRIAEGLDLGGDFGIGCDLIRESSPEYAPRDPASWPDPVSYAIDEERRIQFTTPGNYWCSRVFFYLSYRPVRNRRAKVQTWFFEDDPDTKGFAERALARFKNRLGRFEAVLETNMQSVRRLRCYEANGELYDDLHRYVRHCILGEDYPFLLPEIPVFLNQLITDHFLGGAEPKIGSRNLATVALNGFPKNSYAGILSNLRALPFAYRFTQQSEILDTQQAVDFHDANRKEWGFKKIPFFSRLRKNNPNVRVDTIAAGLEAEANQATVEAEYRRTIDAYYTAKVILADSDPVELREQTRAVLEAIRPFSGRLEDQNAVAALVSSFPGQGHLDKRQNVVTTSNLAHFFPLGAPFRGQEFNPSQYFPAKTPPLFYGVTGGGTPYRFHAHTSDVGHVLLAGPVGSGKTIFLGTGIAQWFRFPDSQVFAFDKKKTLYTLTRAMGGDYYDLGPDSPIRLCPLKYIDTPEDRNSAVEWIEVLCAQNGVAMNAAKVNAITDAIHDMAHSPSRSLTDFHLIVADQDIKDAMRHYTIAGSSGGILDGKDDKLSISRFSVFEMDALYKADKKVMNAVLLYLFRRIQKRLASKRPTLISVDEFREALHHPVAWKAFDDFLNEGRKLNTCVWLALQDLQKVMDSPLKATILEQCLKKILLPNPQAKEAEGGRACYTALGLNSADINLIASGQTKREYYDCSPSGKRMISLDAGKVLLAFLSADDADRAMVDRLIASNPRGWQADWLRYKGLDASGWPEFLEQQLGVENSPVEQERMVAYA